MAKSAYFGPELFEFLTEIKNNNDREWFLANKGRYEQHVRDPFLRLISDLQPGFHDLNPKIVVDPSPTRGSMMRIYRDIRFSADKRPYKTNVAAHFKHAKAKPHAMPGYYIHFAPGDCMLGAGIWHPEPRALQKIRAAIVANPKKWQQLTKGQTLMGDTLKRAPAGCDPNHPLIEDLKRKDFAAFAPLSDADVMGPKLAKVILAKFQAVAPFVDFLSAAVGLS